MSLHLALFLIYREMLVENRQFEPLTSIWAPVGGPLEFRQDFWRQKTIIPSLSYGVVCVIMR